MKKFIDIARWDFTIHRSDYTRMLWMMALIVGLPTISFLASLLFNHLIRNNASYYGNTLGAAKSTLFILGIVQLVAIAMLCYPLKDRPNRLAEFMLPAPKGLKFAWRVLLVTVGVFLYGQLLAIFYGLVRYLFGAFFLGFHSVGPVFWGLGDIFTVPLSEICAAMNSNLALETAGMVTSAWQVFVMMFIDIAAFVSVYALASAVKYRRGMLYGTLVHGIIFSLMVYFVATNGDVPEEASPDGLGWFLYITTFVHLLILVGCWWGAWRLYRNARLTSRRNP